MKRMSWVVLASCAALAVVVAVSRSDRPAPEVAVTSEARNPWTGLKLNNDPGEFQFAIVSDRTGAHRARVFSQAVDRLNLLQPEFVMSVGDLIEGGRKTDEKLKAEWDEFDGYVNRLQMPFFYVPGNHDVGNEATSKFYGERFGRRHYHFVYKNVLFLCLNTDDGHLANPARWAGSGLIGQEQREWAAGVLKANPTVRWTIVCMHKPIWTSAALAKSGWPEVESALADRPYTVFVGHVHRFRKFVRQGRNYYQLATTGGGSKMRGVPYGEFDQIVWVTMKKSGPVLAHVLLDSVLPDDLKEPASEEKGVPTGARLKTVPVRGTVYYDGSPLVGAQVVFATTQKEKTTARADGMTAGDGSFTLSTYTAFDGCPAGEYSVAVTCCRPLLDAAGNPGPNILPARYASAATSGVTVTVKTPPEDGANEKLVIELKP